MNGDLEMHQKTFLAKKKLYPQFRKILDTMFLKRYALPSVALERRCPPHSQSHTNVVPADTAGCQVPGNNCHGRFLGWL